jgi:photosystem II stability/assembly factor-like uncharacterized protein
MIAVVETVAGAFAVDLETEEVAPWEGELEPTPTADVRLPRLVAAAANGATVVAVVDAKPPLVVSHDAGTTWRESGRGLPAGRAVAIATDAPDVFVYAARNRLYLTRDGGVFWTALAVELPEILSVQLEA